MRCVILFFCYSLFSLPLIAQEPADALRYSWFSQGGTARSQAIGGAMASLGGDLSAMFVNPAGMGLYKTAELVFTSAYSFQNNQTSYLGNTQKTKDAQLNFGASGIIIPFQDEKGVITTVGIGINRVANFNNSISYNGLNNLSSYSEKYLEELIRNNVTDPNDAAKNYPNGASLAFNTFLIDTVSGSGGMVKGYRSMSTPMSGVNQQQNINSSGGITDVAISAGSRQNDKLFFGATFTVSIIDYKRNSVYRESDATGITNNDFNYFEAEEYLRTKGAGANFKLGIIYKPIEYLRLGLAFHTPTYYSLKDTYSNTITTDVEGYAGNGAKTQSSKEFNNGQNGEFPYEMLNTGRIMAGASYVFREDRDIKRQRGFISADIEWIPYKLPFFYAGEENEPYMVKVNKTIDKLYKSAFNYRVGAELKFSPVMIRGGLSWYGSPYKPGEIQGSKMNISGGLGYRDKGVFIDLTYVQQITKDGFYPYQLDQGFYAPVNVHTTTGTILMTLGLKF